MNYQYYFDLFVDIITSQIFVSITTAITTVLLTFLFYRIRDKLLALRSIKSEIEYNQRAALELRERIEEDNQLRSAGEEIVESLDSFHTSSFENIKNRGVLDRLSEETKVAILNHYSHIDRINRQIRQRSSIRAGGRALSNYDQMVIAYNAFIQDEVKTVEFENLESQIDSELKYYWPISYIL